MSSAGWRRSSPLTMSLLKFSSAAYRSMSRVLAAARHQAIPDSAQVLMCLDLVAHLGSKLLPFMKVGPDGTRVAQVVGDGRVNLRERDRGVLLGDLLGRCAFLIGANDRVERHPCGAHPHDAVRV